MIIGRCMGETSLTELTFISNKMPNVGEYVSMNYDGKLILGMIEDLVRGNVALNSEIYNTEDIERIVEYGLDEFYVKGKIRVLGDINNHLKLPRTPAPPGTPIELASEAILKKVFTVDNPLS